MLGCDPLRSAQRFQHEPIIYSLAPLLNFLDNSSRSVFCSGLFKIFNRPLDPKFIQPSEKVSRTSTRSLMMYPRSRVVHEAQVAFVQRLLFLIKFYLLEMLDVFVVIVILRDAFNGCDPPLLCDL